jgi:hypothetical protein
MLAFAGVGFGADTGGRAACCCENRNRDTRSNNIIKNAVAATSFLARSFSIGRAA